MTVARLLVQGLQREGHESESLGDSERRSSLAKAGRMEAVRLSLLITRLHPRSPVSPLDSDCRRRSVSLLLLSRLIKLGSFLQSSQQSARRQEKGKRKEQRKRFSPSRVPSSSPSLSLLLTRSSRERRRGRERGARVASPVCRRQQVCSRVLEMSLPLIASRNLEKRGSVLRRLARRSVDRREEDVSRVHRLNLESARVTFAVAAEPVTREEERRREG